MYTAIQDTKLNQYALDLAQNRASDLGRYIAGNEALVILATLKNTRPVKSTEHFMLLDNIKTLYTIEGDSITIPMLFTYMRVAYNEGHDICEYLKTLMLKYERQSLTSFTGSNNFTTTAPKMYRCYNEK